MKTPMRSSCLIARVRSRFTLKPGMLSSLSSVLPVISRPRPEIIAPKPSSQASSGARTSEVFPPIAPVECLSTLGGEFDGYSNTGRSPALLWSNARSPVARAAEKNCHPQRALLVIGNFSASKTGDNLRDFFRAQFAAIALLLNQ